MCIYKLITVKKKQHTITAATQIFMGASVMDIKTMSVGLMHKILVQIKIRAF